MNKKKFLSWLFKREILPEERDYWAIVQAELLHRIAYHRGRNCSCMKCINDLAKYEETLKKLREETK